MACDTRKVFRTFLAGSCSATISTALLQPIDVLKTRKQYLSYSRDTTVTGFQLYRKIVKTEGYKALWGGTKMALVRAVPGVSMYFGVLTLLRAKSVKSSNNKFTNDATLAGISRFICGMALFPINILKTRVESGLFHYTSIVGSIKMIFKNEGGIRGLYRGAYPIIMRDTPFAIIMFPCYQKLKQLAADISSLSPTTRNVCCSFLASAFASALTQPFDVIKTYVQLQMTKNHIPLSAAIKTFVYFPRSILLTGLLLRIARRSFVSAINWPIYEIALHYDDSKRSNLV